jgi:iron complex outermembrane receptor protein
MNKKLFIIALLSMMTLGVYSENINNDSQSVSDTINLAEVTVTSLYRNNVNVGYLIDNKTLISENYGQEPSHLFAKMPNIFSMNDNGTEFGYGYFRIRGLDQTRINVTLDGMPWNESEDYGTYFANSPDLMSSMHSIKVERGSSATNNGTASSGGSINLESINLLNDNTSYAYVGAGSFNTYKTSLIYNSGLINKHHAFHVKATQQQTDGFKDNSFNNSQAFTL